MFHSRTYKIIVIFNILFISKAYEYIFPVERGKEEYSYQSWILGYTYKLTNYPKKSQEIYHCSLLNRDYLIVSFTQRHSHRYNFTNSKCLYIQHLSILINQNVITILIHLYIFLTQTTSHPRNLLPIMHINRLFKRIQETLVAQKKRHNRRSIIKDRITDRWSNDP